MSLFQMQFDGRPVVHVHVPKCGGMAFRAGRHWGEEDYDPDPSWTGPVIGFVRDPEERIVSAYRDFRYLRGETQLGFAEFIRRHARGSRKQIERRGSAAKHIAPMVDPFHGLQHAGFVGRTETMQADFDQFCDLHGIPRQKIPRHHAAGEVPRPEVTAEDRAFIRERWADDFDYLDRLTLNGPENPPPLGRAALTEDRGFLFYLSGTGCVARLAVALMTLRRHHDEPVMLLADAAAAPFCRDLAADPRLPGITVVPHDTPRGEGEHRVSGNGKAYAARRSPFRSTIMLDCDIAVLHPIHELWPVEPGMQWAQAGGNSMTGGASAMRCAGGSPDGSPAAP